MARPLYETEEDRQNEVSVANHLGGLGYDLYKLPIRYELDFAIYDRRDRQAIVGFAEVKRRKVMSDHYPSVMISLSKVLKAKQLTDTTGLPCYLLLRYLDCLGRIDFAADFEVGKGGRYDRGDPQDADVCAYYQLADMMKIVSWDN